MRGWALHVLVLAAGAALSAACARPRVGVPDEAGLAPDSLASALARLDARVVGFPTQTLEFMSDTARAGLAALAGAGARAVPALVECLGDTRRSRVRYRDGRVPVAALCSWLLWSNSWVQQRKPWTEARLVANGIGFADPIDPARFQRVRAAWRQFVSAGGPVEP